MFVVTLENVHSALRIHDLRGKEMSRIVLPSLGTVDGISGESEGNELFFGFTSFTTRYQVYRYDLATRKTTLWRAITSSFKPDSFVTRQVWYRSKDGTRIPMFLIHKKGLRRSRKTPALLYGYGGFNISILPAFQASCMPFLEKGGIYAIANLRGGGEFGEKWHQAGMRGKKQNVFDDFIAAAEWLIKNGYTSKEHIASYGGSNGGLLVGAMITQRPDLFKANIPAVPVMDMLRFHKFHGGMHWMRDYGNPDDPKDAAYLLKYSPYHNIKKGTAYPATLVMTAAGDDRVHPLHAYKFFARLQEANVSSDPLLLRVEKKAGHGGSGAVSKAIETAADLYSFVAWQLGMK
jgi:prolyl oligopeptidase